jgi:hypothetical protein
LYTKPKKDPNMGEYEYEIIAEQFSVRNYRGVQWIRKCTKPRVIHYCNYNAA